jgi:ABC-type multidrug transport system ATPase subunit
VEKLVDRLGLAKSRDSPVGDELIRGLSTGEKKRLDIAVELLAQPKMLFLDEPTSGLGKQFACFFWPVLATSLALSPASFILC